MLCYVMLRYATLCYVMLCYVVLCYVMLCCVVLCYVMLCFVMLICDDVSKDYVMRYDLRAVLLMSGIHKSCITAKGYHFNIL